MKALIGLSNTESGPVTAVERLGAIMQPEEGNPSEAWGVLNPATVRGRDGELYLFARVVAEGNVSRIRMARVLFDRAGWPYGVERLGFALEPAEPYEQRGEGKGGCEDPRITFVPALDCFVLAYTAYGPNGARVALAISSDLFTWERLGPVQFGVQDGVDLDIFDNKDALFFPEPVLSADGMLSFACLHRPMTGADRAWDSSSPLANLPPSIWVSTVPVAEVLTDRKALVHLRNHQVVMRPAHAWEQVKIGGGTPPILLGDSWLVLHHGIENLAAPTAPRALRYTAGAALLDRWDVTRVLWRSPHPLLAPDTDGELYGVVNNVVFPTGIDRVNENVLDVYYGMADARIGAARLHLQAGEQIVAVARAA